MKLIITLILSLFTNIVLYGQCSSGGTFNASGFANNTSLGTIAWSNTSNAQLSDNNYATAGQLLSFFATANTNYLVVTNLGFSIPPTATVCGITVEVERSATGLLIGSSISDNSVKIVKGGSIMGAEQASGSAWPTSDTYTSYGSNIDPWGTTWTSADINASNFGFAISAKLSAGLAALFLTAQVDHIRVTIYYSFLVPATLKSFSAKQVADKIKLEWVTASEFNTSYFLAERSINNYSWSSIDSLPGAGSSSADKYYVSYDNSPGPVNYYRLKQVDLAGKVSLSKVVEVKLSNTAIAGVSISPNPVSSLVTISSRQEIKDVQFIHTNSLAAFPVVYSTQRTSRIYDVKGLPAGIYFVRIYTDGGMSTQKIIVLK